jgi:hypothetical protein
MFLSNEIEFSFLINEKKMKHEKIFVFLKSIEKQHKFQKNK